MKVLIVEDEFSLADAVAEALKKENFNVTIKINGEDGEDEALTGNYDLILLDIMLPKKNGFEILKNLRKNKVDTSVIMLTAKAEIEDKLIGLENGADDYITKPFHIKELIARVKAVLKRSSKIKDDNSLEFGDIKLYLSLGKLTCGDSEIIINGKEFDVLESLILNKNQILDKDIMLEKIWGYYSNADYNNIEVYISFLRKKLKLLNSKVVIKAVRGIGYKLEVEE